MNYTPCQKDLMDYVLGYYKGPKAGLTPCIEVFQEIFKEKFSNLEIEENSRALVSSGFLESYSFHSYLRLTERFKSSKDYKLFRNKKL